jgi:hypothetical protein
LSWANFDGKIRLFVQNVSAKKLTLSMLKKAFDAKKWGKAKRPAVKEMEEMNWATHVGGFVPRPITMRSKMSIKLLSN